MAAKRIFESSDGVRWRVVVTNVGASNAQVIFQHPVGARENRYAHFPWHGPESQNVAGRVDPAAVMSQLDDATLQRLFRRSMPISARPTIEGRIVPEFGII
jgi:hypothetical protein